MASSNPQQNDDVTDWINRFKAVAAKPELLTAPAPESATPWVNRMMSFFDPIDTCLITCCCPCITFGKTHHRLRKDPSMRGYSPINTSCLGWWASGCFGLHWIPNLFQRREIRERYNLEGDCVTDCLRAWCCNCCDLIQQEKESEYHVLQNTEMVVSQQPAKMANGMAYSA